jgi:hypothetical protein
MRAEEEQADTTERRAEISFERILERILQRLDVVAGTLKKHLQGTPDDGITVHECQGGRGRHQRGSPSPDNPLVFALARLIRRIMGPQAPLSKYARWRIFCGKRC